MPAVNVIVSSCPAADSLAAFRRRARLSELRRNSSSRVRRLHVFSGILDVLDGRSRGCRIRDPSFGAELDSLVDVHLVRRGTGAADLPAIRNGSCPSRSHWCTAVPTRWSVTMRRAIKPAICGPASCPSASRVPPRTARSQAGLLGPRVSERAGVIVTIRHRPVGRIPVHVAVEHVHEDRDPMSPPTEEGPARPPRWTLTTLPSPGPRSAARRGTRLAPGRGRRRRPRPRGAPRAPRR